MQVTRNIDKNNVLLNEEESEKKDTRSKIPEGFESSEHIDSIWVVIGFGEN